MKYQQRMWAENSVKWPKVNFTLQRHSLMVTRIWSVLLNQPALSSVVWQLTSSWKNSPHAWRSTHWSVPICGVKNIRKQRFQAKEAAFLLNITWHLQEVSKREACYQSSCSSKCCLPAQGGVRHVTQTCSYLTPSFGGDTGNDTRYKKGMCHYSVSFLMWCVFDFPRKKL